MIFISVLSLSLMLCLGASRLRLPTVRHPVSAILDPRDAKGGLPGTIDLGDIVAASHGDCVILESVSQQLPLDHHKPVIWNPSILSPRLPSSCQEAPWHQIDTQSQLRRPV